MEKIEISDKVVQVVASAAERLIGYFYAGLLPVIILSIERGIAALVGDTRQHSKECAFLEQNKPEMDAFLLRHGFLRNSALSQAGSQQAEAGSRESIVKSALPI